MFFAQAAFDIRCEWGLAGVAQLAPGCDVLVIVDVLSFSTCVDVATARGALVYPCRWHDADAQAHADALGAQLAGPRGAARFSLSPASLREIGPGTRLVLPSPNGATLSVAAGQTPTLAGCLRNAGAVAARAAQIGRRIAVVPAGERWPDGTLRPAFEDLVGAGAIIARLPGRRSPEADAAAHAFAAARAHLPELLAQCGSGKELIGRGWADDVALAAALDVSDCAPALDAGAYRRG